MTYSHNDSLRGLLDSATFFRMLSVFGKGAEPTDRCATIIIDVDHADVLNQRLGDASGDKLLRQVLERCDAALPLQALAARLRSNAIALLLFSHISDEEVDTVCSAIHDALRATFDRNRDPLTLSASIGAAFTSPKVSAIAALQFAETAVQRVKSNGGDATFTRRSSLSLPAIDGLVAA